LRKKGKGKKFSFLTVGGGSRLVKRRCGVSLTRGKRGEGEGDCLFEIHRSSKGRGREDVIITI